MIQSPATKLHTALVATVFLLSAGCAGSQSQGLVPSASSPTTASAANAENAAGAGRSRHQHTTALPIGARAIPIGARAIPIGARAIPINNVTNPPTLSVCGIPILGGAACGAIRRTDIIPALSLLTNAIPGFQPADLAEAYSNGVPANAGTGQTIGIVVANDDPNADSDLAVYRSTFGLSACRVSSGCLRIVNGASPSSALPAPDQNWAQETSIDLDMASAMCPNCKLLLVEAPSADIEALTAGMQTAVSLGATVVSNSFTTPETATVAADNAKWNHPGVPIVAGAGDSGYGVGWPASSSYVTAVGGTTLIPILSGIAWLESAWGDTGSGCSKYIAKPTWQHDAGCKMRTVADTAAVANPSPGVAVYDTYFTTKSLAGWNVFGGTSVATPIIAATYALAGNGKSVSSASGLYANSTKFNDILLGLNGLCLSYLCTSGLGYDGPTGLGTPNGIGAF
jgi:subtilase family serine protease